MRSVLGLAVAGALALAAASPAQAAGEMTVAGDGVDSRAAPRSVVRLAQQDTYQSGGTYDPRDAGDGYEPDGGSYGGGSGGYRQPSSSGGANDAYRPPNTSGGGYGSGSTYNSGPPASGGSTGGYDGRGADDAYRGGAGNDAYQGRSAPPSGGYGQPYAPPSAETAARYDRDAGYPEPRGPGPEDNRGYDDRRTYSQNEIVEAGHGFFGSISKGLASVIEHAFKKAGRPNGYILGEDAGGAFVAGLRYGEGRLYTKDAGTHKVYWQGPSVGYDFGGAGAKAMILVYNLRDPAEIYHRFGGVEGSAYLVGGVSIQFQKYGDVVMAPIRAGIGLRLGANVGYLKYTRRPTWNPF